ncbi:MAG: response regulator [Zetaproteobacteria bacterium]|nr:response regulator [Zetaproteobacteria bacterium]
MLRKLTGQSNAELEKKFLEGLNCLLAGKLDTEYAIEDQPEINEKLNMLRMKMIYLNRKVEQSSNIIYGMEQIESLILITNTQGNITYINKAFSYATAYMPDDLLQKPITAILKAKNNPDSVYKGLCHAISSGKGWYGELKLSHKNSTIIPYGLTLTRIMKDGKTEGFLYVLCNIQNLLSEREKEQKSERIKTLGTLAEGIAHDFNNFFAAIEGHVEILRDDTSQLMQSLDDIHHVSQQGAALCTDMLNYSGYQGKVKRERFAINTMLEQAEHFLAASAEPGVTINFGLDDGEKRLVEADKVQIEQMILHLLTNSVEAIKDCRRGGRILLSTKIVHIEDQLMRRAMFRSEHSAEGDFVRIRIKDNGCGMSQGTIDKLLEPFFTTKPNTKGLGMNAVYGILQTHAGLLFVQSIFGKGTIVDVCIPVLKGSLQQEERASSEVIAQTNITNKTVLVIDDSSSIRMIAQKLIEKHHGICITADDGDTGIETYKEHQEKIDVVVLDMAMKRMNGLECAHGLRKINPNVKIIISTGYSKDVLKQYEASGIEVNAFLPKPYTGLVLIQQLAAQCQQ